MGISNLLADSEFKKDARTPEKKICNNSYSGFKNVVSCEENFLKFDTLNEIINVFPPFLRKVHSIWLGPYPDSGLNRPLTVQTGSLIFDLWAFL